MSARCGSRCRAGTGPARSPPSRGGQACAPAARLRSGRAQPLRQGMTIGDVIPDQPPHPGRGKPPPSSWPRRSYRPGQARRRSRRGEGYWLFDLGAARARSSPLIVGAHGVASSTVKGGSPVQAKCPTCGPGDAALTESSIRDLGSAIHLASDRQGRVRVDLEQRASAHGARRGANS
jgi:hypothetical protein